MNAPRAIAVLLLLVAIKGHSEVSGAITSASRLVAPALDALTGRGDSVSLRPRIHPSAPGGVAGWRYVIPQTTTAAEKGWDRFVDDYGRRIVPAEEVAATINRDIDRSHASNDRCAIKFPVGHVRFTFSSTGSRDDISATAPIISECGVGRKYRIIPIVNGRHANYARIRNTSPDGRVEYGVVHFTSERNSSMGSNVFIGKTSPNQTEMNAVVVGSFKHEGRLDLVDEVMLSVTPD